MQEKIIDFSDFLEIFEASGKIVGEIALRPMAFNVKNLLRLYRWLLLILYAALLNIEGTVVDEHVCLPIQAVSGMLEVRTGTSW